MVDARELKKAAEEQIKKILAKSGLNDPFPLDLNSGGIAPIQFVDKYVIDYLHSYGQDSLFFRALKEKKLLGNSCGFCNYTYATPRSSCMYCGQKTKWIELPNNAKVHAFTVCYEASEAFLDKIPYALALFEFQSTDTLFLLQLKGLNLKHPTLDWIGMDVVAKFSTKLNLKNHTPTIVDVWFEPR